MTSNNQALIDRRADMAACLANNTRRDIRDCLRRYGSLTLSEISAHLNLPEPNIYYHLEQMVKFGVVTKELRRVGGRLIAEYSLSEEYNRLFGEQPTKPDLTPIYLLFITYTGFTLLSGIFGSSLIQLLKPLGIVTVSQLITIGLVGLFTTLLPITYYGIKFHSNLIGRIKGIRVRLGSLFGVKFNGSR